jgi:hypothetical protein
MAYLSHNIYGHVNYKIVELVELYVINICLMHRLYMYKIREL